MNGLFVEATRQCSPRLMVELLAHLGPRLDEVWAGVRLDAPAGVDVSWASTDEPSPAWLDIAREYTEFLGAGCTSSRSATPSNAPVPTSRSCSAR